MKRILSIIAILALTGCSTVEKALKLTQTIEGSGSVTLETHAQLTTVTVENARQDGNFFKADQLDLVHRGKFTGMKLDVHLKPYLRPIIGGAEK
jgi:outer membrane protein assembly factor BamE (lipoprotein component of BamABCDE complex)